MKKLTAVFLALFLLCGMITLGLAQDKCAKKADVKTEVIRGKIISIDTAKKEVVVRDMKSGTNKTITADPRDIASLKIAEDVKVYLNEGSSIAKSIRQVVKTSAAAAKKQ